MAMRDLVSDLSALVLPSPVRSTSRPLDEQEGSAEREAAEEEGWWEVEDQVRRERAELAERLRLGWDEGEVDPLLSLIAQARATMLDAEQRMRLLIAYAREFVGPRPYTLDDLARAAGMSISGVRTAYDDDEIADVAARTGARPRRRPDTGTAAPRAAGDVDRGEERRS